MKHKLTIFLSLFLLLFFCLPVLARVEIPILNDYSINDIIIIEGQTGRFLGSMKKSEFKELVKGSNLLLETIKAEKEGRILIKIEGNEIELTEGKPTTIKLNVIWYKFDTENIGKIIYIKELEIEQKLVYHRKKGNLLFRTYQKVAIYGFPITAGLCIILFLI